MAIDIHLRCCSALPSHCLISFACVSLHPCVAKSCALDPTAKRDLPELSRCWNLVPFFKSVDFTAIFCHMHDFQVWTKRLVQYAGGFGGGDFDSAVSAYFQVLENAKGHWRLKTRRCLRIQDMERRGFKTWNPKISKTSKVKKSKEWRDDRWVCKVSNQWPRLGVCSDVLPPKPFSVFVPYINICKRNCMYNVNMDICIYIYIYCIHTCFIFKILICTSCNHHSIECSVEISMLQNVISKQRLNCCISSESQKIWRINKSNRMQQSYCL